MGGVIPAPNRGLPTHERAFPVKLPFDVAIAEKYGYDISFTLSKYRLDLDAYIDIKKNPEFQRRVSEYKEDLVGTSEFEFKEYAKAISHEALAEIHKIIRDDAASPSVKVSAASEVIRWAGLDPKTQAPGSGKIQDTFKININVGAAADNVQIVSHIPGTEEDDDDIIEVPLE